MRVAVFILITFIAFVACKKENRLQVPISSVAAAWIPAEQDSVKFNPELSTDTAFARYAAVQKQWINVGGGSEKQVITQNMRSLGGNFKLIFNLQTEMPENLPAGGFARRENLTLTNTFGEDYIISFYRDTITTDLFIIDSLEVNNALYTNVLTDNQTFFYNRQFLVFRYLDNNIWHNLIR